MRNETGSNSGVGFEMVVRIAGWNDTDDGVQLMLGHEGGAWRFDSSEGEGLEIPAAVGRDLARLFERAAAGEQPDSFEAWPLPADKSWLIEGFGRSEVLVAGRFDPRQWHMRLAAMIVYNVHQLLLGGAFEPDRAVTVLVAEVDDGTTVTIDAGWSSQGFVYRLVDQDQPHLEDLSAWPEEGTTPNLSDLLPWLAGSAPVVVHPVAAWTVLHAIEAADDDEDEGDELDHFAWAAFAVRAIRGCDEAALPPISEPGFRCDPPAPPPFASRIASLTSDVDGVFQVVLAVTGAGETRTYEMAVESHDGTELAFDEAASAAIDAMYEGEPAEHDGEAYRLYVTGHILNQWLERLGGGDIFWPLAPTTAELKAWSACNESADVAD